MLQQWEQAMEQAKHLSSMHNTVHKFWSTTVLCSGVLLVCGGKQYFSLAAMQQWIVFLVMVRGIAVMLILAFHSDDAGVGGPGQRGTLVCSLHSTVEV
jgi:hypothetical protein